LTEQRGTSELVAAHPGLARLIETLRTEGNGHVSPPVLEARPAPEPTAAPPAVDEEFLRAVAAATELVAAYRSFGHLAARLDPLGTEPVGDPSLIWFGFLGVCQIVRSLDGNDRALGRPKEACPQPAPPPNGAPAGAKGTVGPDLDKQPAEAKRAGQQLESFVRESIVNPNAYIEPGFPKGVMPPSFGTTITKRDLDALVQYLIQSSKGVGK